MNPYQTAQTRINQLVGVKPTTSKNTFKNTDMKTINLTFEEVKDLITAVELEIYTCKQRELKTKAKIWNSERKRFEKLLTRLLETI